MRKSRILSRLWSGVFVVAVAAGTVLLANGVSDAAPPAGTPGVVAASASSTTLSTSPTSPVTYGTQVTLIAKVTQATVSGTVEFVDKTADGATAELGTVTVSNGIASLSTETLKTGAHSLTAVFYPSDLALYGGSTSDPVTFLINALPEATTTRQATILTESTGSMDFLLASPKAELAAKLTEAATGAPVVGRRIDFSGGGQLLCYVRTDADGWARCSGPENVGPQTAREVSAGYYAVFYGDEKYSRSIQHASATIGTAPPPP